MADLQTICLERQVELRRFLRARLGDAPDLDDLLQEIFLKAAAVAPDAVIANPPAYLYRLAANVLLDRARGQRRAMARDAQWHYANHEQSAGGEALHGIDAEAAVMARQKLQAIAKALETLGELTQSVFRLHKFSGLSHAETATRLGISKSAVEKHVSLALKHIAIKTAGFR